MVEHERGEAEGVVGSLPHRAAVPVRPPDDKHKGLAALQGERGRVAGAGRCGARIAPLMLLHRESDVMPS